MKVYLAGQTRNLDGIFCLAAELRRASGGEHDFSNFTHCWWERFRQFQSEKDCLNEEGIFRHDTESAALDRRGVEEADLVIFWFDGTLQAAGMWTELGLALALGKPVVFLGVKMWSVYTKAELGKLNIFLVDPLVHVHWVQARTLHAMEIQSAIKHGIAELIRRGKGPGWQSTSSFRKAIPENVAYEHYALGLLSTSPCQQGKFYVTRSRKVYGPLTEHQARRLSKLYNSDIYTHQEICQAHLERQLWHIHASQVEVAMLDPQVLPPFSLGQQAMHREPSLLQLQGFQLSGDQVYEWHFCAWAPSQGEFWDVARLQWKADVDKLLDEIEARGTSQCEKMV